MPRSHIGRSLKLATMGWRRKARVKSIITIFQSLVMSTFVRLRSVSRTSALKTRMRYICLFQASGLGGLTPFFRRSPSSIMFSTHQLREPFLPFHIRSACTGIMYSTPSSVATISAPRL